MAATRSSSEWFGDAPSAHGVVLRLAGLPRRRFVAIGRPARRCARRPPGPLHGWCRWGRRTPTGNPRVRLRLTDRGDHVRRPAVHARRTLRRGRREHDAAQQVGRISAISCATKLPSEKPRRSTRSRPMPRGTRSRRGPSLRRCSASCRSWHRRRRCRRRPLVGPRRVRRRARDPSCRGCRGSAAAGRAARRSSPRSR